MIFIPELIDRFCWFVPISLGKNIRAIGGSATRFFAWQSQLEIGMLRKSKRGEFLIK